MPTEFLLPSEVQEITRLRDPTRKRMEKRGLFPARIRIAPRNVSTILRQPSVEFKLGCLAFSAVD
jgi:hypothetical protein